jgi:hypothetical protein
MMTVRIKNRAEEHILSTVQDWATMHIDNASWIPEWIQKWKIRHSEFRRIAKTGMQYNRIFQAVRSYHCGDVVECKPILWLWLQHDYTELEVIVKTKQK